MIFRPQSTTTIKKIKKKAANFGLLGMLLQQIPDSIPHRLFCTSTHRYNSQEVINLAT
jgi:hypothetical protein